MPDEHPMAAPDTTIRDRLLAAGLDDTTIARHFAAGLVRVDGEPATGPEQLCPFPMTYVIGGAS